MHKAEEERKYLQTLGEIAQQLNKSMASKLFNVDMRTPLAGTGGLVDKPRERQRSSPPRCDAIHYTWISRNAVGLQ